MNKSPVRIIPLGGLGEIGMNCLLFECEDEIIVVDCGILFSDLEHFGVQFEVPDLRYLIERKDKIKAFILTHGHEDHIGGMPFALKMGLNAPIYASSFTTLLLRERLTEYGYWDRADVRTFKMGDEIKFKHFKVTPVSVNHSIVDAAALLIDSPHGKIIHTGDFRIDATPYYGSNFDSEIFKKAGDEGVLLLLSDSTNIERHSHSISEKTVFEGLHHYLEQAKGYSLIAMFASNIARMGQVLEIANLLGKKVAVSGRTMDQNTKLGVEAGYLSYLDKVVIPLEELHKFSRKDIIILSTGSQGEPFSSLARIAHGEHSDIQLQKGDQVIMSSRFIPGNEKEVWRMINGLFRQGAEVVYDSVQEIHASGHATRPELKQMLQWTKPRYFIPIHGEYRHLVHHVELAKEVGLKADNVKVLENYEVLEVSETKFECRPALEKERVWVEDNRGHEITKTLLKDRRQLGRNGIIYALLSRHSETGKVISGPSIYAHGIAPETISSFLLDEARKKLVELINGYHLALKMGREAEDLSEMIRVELRRFFKTNLHSKPVILPIIIELK